MKFIIGFLLLFAGLKAIGSVPYRFSESPWISESVADEGKYHMPGMKAKPKKYWKPIINFMIQLKKIPIENCYPTY